MRLGVGQVSARAETESRSAASLWDKFKKWYYGPCVGVHPQLGGWADCQASCMRQFGRDAKGNCRAVSVDCTCLWCECHDFGGGTPPDLRARVDRSSSRRWQFTLLAAALLLALACCAVCLTSDPPRGHPLGLLA